MIQLSFAVRGTPPPVPPSPLRLAAHPLGTRVTGVWEARGGASLLASLTAARRELAAWLATLAPETPVVDLFLGLEEPAAAAARRLQAPPSPTTALGARHAIIDGRPWLRVFGLYQLGRPDLVISLEPDVDIGAAYVLATRLGLAQLAHDDAFPKDRAVPFGYWLIGFGAADLADEATWDLLRAHLHTRHLIDAFDDRMAAPAPELVLEAADVAQGGGDTWVIGASRALRTWSAQTAARARLGLGTAGEAPNATDAALLCDRLDAGRDAFFGYRDAPEGDLDSGWRFACLDPDHTHDAASTRVVPVSQFVARFPPLAAYLALPVGWVVSRDDGAFWLTEPGDERAVLDPELPPGAPWDAPPAPAPAPLSGRKEPRHD